MKKKTIIIIVVMVIIIAVAAVVAVLLLNKKSPNKQQEQIQEINDNSTHIIEGTYTDEKVTNLASAKKSLENIKEEINIKDLDELKEDTIYDGGSSINIYSFYQTKNNVQVFDSYLQVYTDKEGTVHGVINNLKDVKDDIDTENILSKKEAKQKLNDYLKEKNIDEYSLEKENLYIYPFDNKNLVVYYYNIKINMQNIVVIEDAKNGKILKPYNSYNTSDLTEERINKYKVKSDYYEMVDKKRNLTMSRVIDSETDELYTWKSLEDAQNKELDDSIDHFENVMWVYDFYYNNYNIKGFGNGVENVDVFDQARILTFIDEETGEKETYDMTDNAFFSENKIVFGAERKPNIETTAHEYTHGIFTHNVKDLGEPSKENVEASSINEGYADVMAMALEAYYKGDDNLDGTQNRRDIKNSTIDYNEFLDKGYSENKREEHYYSVIISRVAYDTSKYLTLDEYTDLWFDAMFLLKGTDCHYYNVRYAVIRVAESRFDSETVEKIKKSFDDVGIPDLEKFITIKRYDEDRWSDKNVVKKHKVTTKTEIPKKDNKADLHTYKIFESNNGFEAAKKSCKDKGGYLATITSEEENTYVYNFMRGQGYESAYFGLTDIEDDTWKWVNGEKLDYTNWAEGEPNHENNVEHYGMFYWKNKYTWNDGDFGTSTVAGGNAYICEFE